MKLLFAAGAALLLFGACVPPLPEEDIPRHFDIDTVMGVIQERGELRVGIDPALPPFSSVDADGKASGLAVDLAEEIAHALRVKVVYKTAPSRDLLSLFDASSVDVAFPLQAVTEKLARKYAVSDPYYVAHERYLGDMSGKVCSLVDPETEVAVEDLFDGTTSVPALTPSECAEQLSASAVNGVIGADTLLMTVIADSHKSYQIAGDEYSTEGISAVVAAGVSGWQGYIDNVLEDMKSEGRWVASYDRWVRPYAKEAQEPPDMTAEEAAALYPKDL